MPRRASDESIVARETTKNKWASIKGTPVRQASWSAPASASPLQSLAYQESIGFGAYGTRSSQAENEVEESEGGTAGANIVVVSRTQRILRMTLT